MSERIHVLAQQLLQKPSLQACNLDEIRRLVANFPYFAPARFLLLQKLKEERSGDYTEQLQKAVLYYHDPILFEQFISADRFHTDLELSELPEESAAEEWALHAEPDATTEAGYSSPDAPAPSEQSVIGEWERPVSDVQPGEEIETAPPVREEEAEEKSSYEEEYALEQPAYEQEVEEPEELFWADEPESVKEAPQAEAARNVSAELIADANPEVELALDGYEEQSVAAGIIRRTDEEKETTGAAATAPAQPAASAEVPVDLYGNELLEGGAEEQKAEKTVEAPLAFEPYHTVDYFASQGIRLPANEVPKDKFSRQVKSFTEWLRTMKRLPSTEEGNGLDDTSERRVQHLADRSVNETDIVTEAMAEVWIKQGAPEKARAVYEKLSLQNPSKRAYFAAKIENLKRS